MQIIMISMCFWLLLIWFIIRQFLKIQRLERKNRELKALLEDETKKKNTYAIWYESLKKALGDNDEVIASAKH